MREQFLKDYPDVVRRVLAVYEEARKYSLANYDDLKKTFIAVTKLPEAVVDKQHKERTELTRMYGPAVPCKRFHRSGKMRSCINVSGLWLERSAPGHHGYQRAFELISRQASTGPFGSPVFACAGKTDFPSSSHPLADLGG